MFRDGQYLEVIKASDNCLATAVVTVEEKMIEIRKKKVSTNKWLDLEDWAALYKILERAILRNVRAERSRRHHDKCEWKKSTRQLEVTYTFEPSECLKDVASLPTIRVNVSPARKNSEIGESVETSSTAAKKSPDNDVTKKESGESRSGKTRRYLRSEDSRANALEEYVPDAAKKLRVDVKYVPSRKSTLEALPSNEHAEYTPTTSINKSAAEVVRYVPNSVGGSHETYEPCGALDLPGVYVPTSKGVKASFEEYQPDFTSKSMKFDNSYVPSSVRLTNQKTENAKKLSRRPSSGRTTAR